MRRFGLALAAVLVLCASACTTGNDGEVPVIGGSSTRASVHPVDEDAQERDVNSAGVQEPASGLSEESRFDLGPLVISEEGITSGNYTLDEAIHPGDRLKLIINCTGGEGEISVGYSDNRLFSTGCASPSGVIAGQPDGLSVESLTVDAPDGAYFWLQGFLVRAGEPRFTGTSTNAAVRNWSTERIPSTGRERARIAEQVMGTVERDIELDAGTYRWQFACNHSTSGAGMFRIDVEDVSAQSSIQCDPAGGIASALFTLKEAGSLHAVVSGDPSIDVGSTPSPGRRKAETEFTLVVDAAS